MLRRTLCVLALTLGLTEVLAAPGGAAPKPPTGTDSVTCSMSAGTTFTWTSDTTQIQYVFYRDTAGTTPAEQGLFKTHGTGPKTIATPIDAVALQVLFVKKSGIAGKTPVLGCSA